MPGGDGTGPGGMGPMTGRAAGYCAGYPVPGYMNPVGGRGFWGAGWGGGSARRNWFYAAPLAGWPWAAPGYAPFGGAPVAGLYGGPVAPVISRKQQLDALKGQAEYLEDALEGIRKRIAELAANSASD